MHKTGARGKVRDPALSQGEGTNATTDYYSAIKKNEMMSFTGKWMELEIIHVKGNKPELNRRISHFLSSVESRPKKI
jgi:hypothetical protein